MTLQDIAEMNAVYCDALASFNEFHSDINTILAKRSFIEMKDDTTLAKLVHDGEGYALHFLYRPFTESPYDTILGRKADGSNADVSGLYFADLGEAIARMAQFMRDEYGLDH